MSADFEKMQKESYCSMIRFWFFTLPFNATVKYWLTRGSTLVFQSIGEPKMTTLENNVTKVHNLVLINR